MIDQLRQIASAADVRFGSGTRSEMRAFFDEGEGIFAITENTEIMGAKSVTVYVRGAKAAQVMRAIEGEFRRTTRVRVSRTGSGYIVTLYISARMRFGKPRRPQPTPPTPSVTPLFFEAKQANSTVSMMSLMTTAPDIEYSEDGTTWQEWQHTTSEGTHTFDTITLGAVGDKVYFRGTNAAMADLQNQQMSVFMPTGDVKVGGSVQSLVDGTGESTTAICMAALFASSRVGGSATALTEVGSGLLPATTLADYCYSSMFYGCASLTTAPALPATTLADNCYFGMFYSCTSLASITCLATDISATYCTADWVNGVAANGTFTKAAVMSGWTEGADGIPSGWTVADYSA